MMFILQHAFTIEARHACNIFVHKQTQTLVQKVY